MRHPMSQNQVKCCVPDEHSTVYARARVGAIAAGATWGRDACPGQVSLLMDRAMRGQCAAPATGGIDSGWEATTTCGRSSTSSPRFPRA
jgi:hypothetical protein